MVRVHERVVAREKVLSLQEVEELIFNLERASIPCDETYFYDICSLPIEAKNPHKLITRKDVTKDSLIAFLGLDCGKFDFNLWNVVMWRFIS